MQFYRKSAEEVFPNLSSLQFVFIDSSHLFDLTVTEVVLTDKKLDVGGVLAFHDMWMPSLQKVVRYVLQNRSYEIIRSDSKSPPARLRVRIKNAVARCLGSLPLTGRIFREEILKPLNALQLDNLVLKKMTGSDQRDWRFHHPF